MKEKTRREKKQDKRRDKMKKKIEERREKMQKITFLQLFSKTNTTIFSEDQSHARRRQQLLLRRSSSRRARIVGRLHEERHTQSGRVGESKQKHVVDPQG